MRLFFPSSSSCCHYSNKARPRGLLPEINNTSAAAAASNRRPKWVHMASITTASAAGNIRCRQKNDGGGGDDENQDRKIVVILGATGSGKSRLSIDLATLFSGEIVNSDKIQLYSGLDITTNKLPQPQRRGVPHHLLGDVDSLACPELSASDYRSLASLSISDIALRNRVPVVAGGSNSFIYALLARRFDPERSVFEPESNPVSAELRYRCCFLWVDVSPAVLTEYLDVRVDDMLGSGMFEELAEFFDSEGIDPGTRSGLRKAIGVPEFAPFFGRFPGRVRGTLLGGGEGMNLGGDAREVYEGAVRAIKDNTCQLARRQVGKIQRLRDSGWDLHRIDATEVFRGVLADSGKSKYDAVWDRRVLDPSVKIVRRFLDEE